MRAADKATQSRIERKKDQVFELVCLTPIYQNLESDSKRYFREFQEAKNEKQRQKLAAKTGKVLSKLLQIKKIYTPSSYITLLDLPTIHINEDSPNPLQDFVDTINLKDRNYCMNLDSIKIEIKLRNIEMPFVKERILYEIDGLIDRIKTSRGPINVRMREDEKKIEAYKMRIQDISIRKITKKLYPHLDIDSQRKNVERYIKEIKTIIEKLNIEISEKIAVD
jgi:hypothetical protein